MAPVLSLLATGLLVISGALAHPGHSVEQEAAERGHWLRTRQPNSVRSCAGELRRRGHMDAAIARRQELAKHARTKRGLNNKGFVRRGFAEYNISHASDVDATVGSDETMLFADDSSCVLQPEVTEGPYYINGEHIRSDTVEGQAGVPMWLDVQIVDTSNCEPVPAVFMEMWHCNATGVYSGVVASGNGNENDTSNINETWLRGIQPTDSNGVAQFETIIPGHYTGRAPHIHILTHPVNSTIVRTNGTILDSANNFTSTSSHVGQIFFDQSLLTDVAKLAPYNTNTQDFTYNDVDSILIEETANMDPFVEYVLIGDTLEDGVLAWISLGIDPTADNSVRAAGTMYETGGVASNAAPPADAPM